MNLWCFDLETNKHQTPLDLGGQCHKTKGLSHDLSVIFGSPIALCLHKSKNNKPIDLGRQFAWTFVALKMPPDNLMLQMTHLTPAFL